MNLFDTVHEFTPELNEQKNNKMLNHNLLIDCLPTVDVVGFETQLQATNYACTSQKTEHGASFHIKGLNDSPAVGVEILGDYILDDEYGPTLNGWEIKVNGVSWNDFCFVDESNAIDDCVISDITSIFISNNFENNILSNKCCLSE